MIVNKQSPRFFGMPVNRRQNWPGQIPPKARAASTIGTLARAGRMFPGLAGQVGGIIRWDIPLAPAMIIGGGLMGAAEWGNPTGLSEDYIGGFTYGATREAGSNIAGVAGALIGAGIGTAAAGAFSMGWLGPVGTIAGGLIGYQIGSSMFSRPAYQLGRFVSRIGRTGRIANNLQMGGNYIDTQAAFTMRQQAIMEMSGSLLNARQYLGNEAALLKDF